MANIQLLSSLLRDTWLIDPAYANGLLPMVKDFMAGKSNVFAAMEGSADPYTASAYIKTDLNIKEIFSEKDLQPGAVAVIGLSGPVMKEDYCGAPGTATLMARFNEAVQNPNISAILLKIETGGGAVNGTFEFADMVRNSPKPVVNYVEGMSCSAGYAISSGATAILLSHKTAQVGSIGVCCSIVNYDKRADAMGIKEHYINASTSPDKNADYLKALNGDYKGMQKNSLDKLHKIFIDTVKEGRGDKLSAEANPFTGKVYFAEEALEIGLIDGICTFEDALDYAFELGKTKKS
jgi:protease IV